MSSAMNKSLASQHDLRELRPEFEMVCKYADGSNRFNFFWSGFFNSITFKHTPTDYHGEIDQNYFDEIVWKKVGDYLYRGIDKAENGEEKIQGIKAKYQQSHSAR